MAALIYCIFDRAAGPLPPEAPAAAALFVCHRCDAVIASRAARPIRKCPKPLTLSERAASYAWSTVRWGLALFPARSKEEILRILETYCGPCEFFDPTEGRCRRCGCCASKHKLPLSNKLARATEHCPIDLW